MGLLGWFNSVSSLVTQSASRRLPPLPQEEEGVHHVQGQEEVNNIMKNLDEVDNLEQHLEELDTLTRSAPFFSWSPFSIILAEML